MTVKDTQFRTQNSRGNTDAKDGNAKAKQNVFQLFKYSTPLDIMLLIFGVLGSAVSSACVTIKYALFGNVADVYLDPTILKYLDDSSVSSNHTDMNLLSNSTGSPPNDSYSVNHALAVSEFLQTSNTYFIILTILGAVGFFAIFIQTFSWDYGSERRIKHLRKLYFSQVIRQDISWFDTNTDGNLSNKLADDMEKLRDATGSKFGMAVQYVIQAGITFGTCLYLSPSLTLPAVITLPIAVVLTIYCTKLASRSGALEQQRYAIAGAVAEETLSNVRTVMAFDGQSREIERYGAALREAYAVSKAKCNVMAWCSSFSVVLYTAVSGATFWYWFTFMQNDISPGRVITIFLLVPSVFICFKLAYPFCNSIGQCYGISAAIHKVISSRPVIDSHSTDGTKPTALAGRIELKNVHFSYPSRINSPVLKGLNLIAQPGQRVAIVGSSGSGKSTIVSLLLRFYDTLQGRVLIDDIPISEYNISWLRSQIGIVSQEPVLFGVSIADNIAMGKENASMEEIIEAAKKANAHDFISGFPKAYDTLVGDTGTQLSGGQKQRIAIARALIRDPKILLLDEATSALDSISENVVQEALEKAMAGRTTIIIAHRLSTIQDADLINVMQNGEILESGTHFELMENQSLYCKLVTTQQSSLAKWTEMNEDEIHSPSIQREGIRNGSQEVRHEVSSIGGHESHRKIQTGEAAPPAVSDFDELFVENQKSSSHGNTNQPAQSEKMEQKFSFLEFMKFQKPEWKWLLMGFTGCMSDGLRFTAVGVLTSQLVPIFSQTGAALDGAARTFIISYAVLSILSGLANYMADKGMAEASKQLIVRTRLLVFENILRQPVAWFDLETSSPGILVNRLARTAPLIEAASGLRVGRVMSAIVTLISAFLIGFLTNWKLTLVMLLFILVTLFTAYMQQNLQMKNQLRDANQSDTAGRVALETLRNIRTVKALGREELFTNIYTKYLEIPYKEAKKQAFLSGFTRAVVFSVSIFMFGFAFKVGGYLFEHGEIQPNDILTVYFPVAFSAISIMFIFSYVQDNTKARTALKLLNYLLTRKSKLDGTAETGLKMEIDGNIEFRDVHFSYPTRRNVKVLNGLSCTVEAGKTLALVGESGSGKSTVVSLLERYYDADSGKILLDGCDIQTLNLRDLRFHIGLITQEPVLFNTTIKDNIAYGAFSSQEPVKFDDIQKAAEIANAHEFIMSLSQRYDTLVGERGVQLSGGQKQRLAIARALIRNPKILVMDEATSALDVESEKVVQAALNNAKRGRTCIIIAHRLSTVQDADKICVISNGKIVESGTHEELQNLEGHYASLVRKQLL